MLVHSTNWTNWPATSRPSYTTHSLVSLMTWFVTAKLGQLVLSQFQRRIPIQPFTIESVDSRTGIQFIYVMWTSLTETQPAKTALPWSHRMFHITEDHSAGDCINPKSILLQHDITVKWQRLLVRSLLHSATQCDNGRILVEVVETWASICYGWQVLLDQHSLEAKIILLAEYLATNTKGHKDCIWVTNNA